MATGLSFPQLAQKVAELNEIKRDFKVPQGAMHFVVQEASPNGQPSLIAAQLQFPDRSHIAVLTDYAYQQALEICKIPKVYGDLLRSGQPDLLENNINRRLSLAPAVPRYVRTYDDPRSTARIRAILSDKFRALDYYDLVRACAQKFAGSRFQVLDSNVTDTSLYIKATVPSLFRAVKGSKVENDVIAPMIYISNSEVGAGRVKVSRGTYRKVCNNGMCREVVKARNHVGRGTGLGDDGHGFEVNFSDETRNLMDAAFWAELSDTIDAAVSEESFNAVMAKLEGIATVELPSPKFAVEYVQSTYKFTSDEADAIMDNLIKGGDSTHYGLWNAVTALSHTTEDYDRAVEIERIGSQVLDINPSAFSKN
jgi:hypothetical protein